jgi:hypothetical protein
MPKPRTNAKAKLAMEWAWRYARRLQTLRGGSVRQYMSEALKQAWAEVKADPTVAEADKIIAEIRAAKINNPVRYIPRRSFGYVFGCAQR